MIQICSCGRKLSSCWQSTVWHTASLIIVSTVATKEENNRGLGDRLMRLWPRLGHNTFVEPIACQEQLFLKLHRKLAPALRKKFHITMKIHRNEDNSEYVISSHIRLSAAIRYLAGASPLDIMRSHGISFTSVFTSVWGVVDVVNQHPEFEIKFPDNDEQRRIANGFERRSGAGFPNCVGALDGILI